LSTLIKLNYGSGGRSGGVLLREMSGADECSDIVDNPLVGIDIAADKGDAWDVRMEIALGELKASGSGAEQTVVNLLRQREQQLEAKVAALEAKLGQNAAPAEAMVHAMVKRIAGAPANWHQTVLFFAASSSPEDAEMRARAPRMFLASVLMVLGQCMASVSVLTGTLEPSCESSDQCRLGGWCQVVQRRCRYCGEGALPLQIDSVTGASYNDYKHEAFVGYNLTHAAIMCAAPSDMLASRGGSRGEFLTRDSVASWCDACLHPATGTVDPLTEVSLAIMNIRSMGAFDWIALVFATTVVAFTAVGELEDIHLCNMAAWRAAEDLTPRWRLAFALVGLLRRFTFLPSLVALVPMLVAYQGGDALSVSLYARLLATV
jgi:hypothetical protein